MLSPLQRRVAALFRELPDPTEFALAGGGALILHGQIDRLTRDLDYFAIDPHLSIGFCPSLKPPHAPAA